MCDIRFADASDWPLWHSLDKRIPRGLFLGKAAVGGHTDGFVKIVAEAESGRILGAHIIGCGACDLIGEASLAVENGLTLEEVKNAIHPHPGLAEAIAESVHHALGTPLNFLPPPPRRSRR